MGLAQYLNEHRHFFVLLFVVLVVHLVFLPGFHELWWDSGVYVGMGKHIFSAGDSGLWEHIRPPLLPLFLGFFWFVGLDVSLAGLILELLFSIGAVFLFYEITRYYFDEKSALFGSSLFAFSSIFFYLSFHLYTEVPAVFFVLLAVYLFSRERLSLAGAACAAAFLFKFPAGMFFPVLLFVLLLDREFRGAVRLVIGFFVPIMPVLFIYQLFYGNALLPFIEARQAILQVLGCNVLRYKPWWHYLYLIVSENILNLFALVGLLAFFSDFKKKRLVPFLCLLVPFVYFSQLHCRDYRYLVLFIPFVALFSASGLVFLLGCFRKHSRKIFVLLLLIVLGFSVFKGVLFYLSNENRETNPSLEAYYLFLEGKNVSGEVWSSNPVISFYTDAAVNPMYYPVYDAGVSADFYSYLVDNQEDIGYVLLDNCGGGIICAPDDAACEKQNEKILSFLESEFDAVFSKKHGNCFYLIFKN